MSTIYILWLRQLKRYVRSKPRMVGALGQPLLFLVALGFGFGPIYAKAGGGNYIDFLAPGIIAMGVLFTAVFTGIEIIWDRQFGFLKETLVAPVSRMQIMIGRTLGGATVATIQGLIVFLMTLAIGFRPASVLMLPVALVFIFVTAVFFAGLGTCFGSYLEDMQAFPLIMNFLMMPLFFLSGSLFPLAGLPAGIQAVAAVDPLTFGVDGLRGALTGMSHFSMGIDFVILSLMALTVLSIGRALFARIQI
ncbi:MAG: ABC transporter permease [Patescibacteria group bacterium]|nr:ABC transporter permease [Patescibacteria group bacterium]